MFLKKYKPTTPTQRFKKFFFKFFIFNKIKQLSTLNKNNAGRNNTGKITVFSKGPRFKNKYFFTDQLKIWNNGLYFISSIISSKKKILALIKYLDGSYSYSSLAYGSYVGQILNTSNLPKRFWYKIKPGNTVLLRFLKKYSLFFNFNIKNKIMYARSSGTFCQVINILLETNLCKILLPSGSKKIVQLDSFVTIGRCSNIFNLNVVYGKAGYLKFRGKKPKNRGVARNPVDHPHGGRTKSNSPEVSPWGWIAKRNK